MYSFLIIFLFTHCNILPHFIHSSNAFSFNKQISVGENISESILLSNSDSTISSNKTNIQCNLWSQEDCVKNIALKLKEYKKELKELYNSETSEYQLKHISKSVIYNLDALLKNFRTSFT